MNFVWGIQLTHLMSAIDAHEIQLLQSCIQQPTTWTLDLYHLNYRYDFLINNYYYIILESQVEEMLVSCPSCPSTVSPMGNMDTVGMS